MALSRAHAFIARLLAALKWFTVDTHTVAATPTAGIVLANVGTIPEKRDLKPSFWTTVLSASHVRSATIDPVASGPSCETDTLGERIAKRKRKTLVLIKHGHHRATRF